MQGNTRISCPFTKSSVQTEQARPLSAMMAGSDVPSCPCTVSAAATVVTTSGPSAAGALSTSVPDSLDCSPGSWVLFAPFACVAFPNSTSCPVTCGLSSSLSPNLTIGNVSSIALAIPLALLCLGLPKTLRGPYLSGWRCALIAPTTMIVKKSAVMMPVML